VRENSAVPPGLESFLPLFPALKCVRENYSFAPLGLHDLPHFTHGLRRGLHSYAASRLKIWSVTPPRRRNSSSHAHAEATAPRKIASKIEFFRNILESKGNLNGSGQECPLYTQKWPGFLRETWGTHARFSAVGEGIPQAMGRGRENFPTQAKRGLEWGTRRGRENFPTQAKRGLEWGTRLYTQKWPGFLRHCFDVTLHCEIGPCGSLFRMRRMMTEFINSVLLRRCALTLEFDTPSA
jgi:hypothetical protein